MQIDININNNIISLLSIYRPPDKKVSNFVNELDTIINKIKKKQELIIVGDMNVDIKKENKSTTTYLDMLLSNGLQCLINEYTREDVKKSTTCIDHLFFKINDSNTRHNNHNYNIRSLLFILLSK